MEDDKVLKSLEEIGIEEKPARVYLATLELGGDIASVIARKANIERVNTYYILESLAKQGLVYTGLKDGKRIYVAHSPKKLATIAEARLKQIKGLMPELLSLEGTNEMKPKIKFYEGIEGIKQVWEETLNLPGGTETLAYSSPDLINQTLGEEWVTDYIKRRTEKGITQRAIIKYSESAVEHQKNDQNEGRNTILVPEKNFPFQNQVGVYGNMTVIISYKDLIGVIIESKYVTDTQRGIFELAWLGAKEANRAEMGTGLGLDPKK